MTVASIRVEWVDLMGLDEPGAVIQIRAHSFDATGHQIPGQGISWQRPLKELSVGRRAIIMPMLDAVKTQTAALVNQFDEERAGREPIVSLLQLSRGFADTQYEVNVRYHYAGEEEFGGALLFSVYADRGMLNYREPLPAGIVDTIRQKLVQWFETLDDIAWRIRQGGVR